METMTVYFNYLDGLRKSGATNMFGAGAYLEAVFDLNRAEAKRILLAWMKTFDEEKTVEERAAEVI